MYPKYKRNLKSIVVIVDGVIAVCGQLWIENILDVEGKQVIDVVSFVKNIKVLPKYCDRNDILSKFVDVLDQISLTNNCSLIKVNCRFTTKDMMIGKGYIYEEEDKFGAYFKELK